MTMASPYMISISHHAEFRGAEMAKPWQWRNGELASAGDSRITG